jgi:hypothetical protein
VALFSIVLFSALLAFGCVNQQGGGGGGVEPTIPPLPSEEPSAAPTEEPVACTMDARICPDGSAVGRVAPDCEFAPCPTFAPKDLPDESLCESTETGWKCVLSKSNVGHSPEFNALKAEFKQACESRNGLFRVYGMGFPSYPHFCDFAFFDAGKECTDSSQCQGTCVLADAWSANSCKENCVGECSEFVLHDCDNYAELIGGKAELHRVLCD